jgi:hypothetical protein
VTKVNGVFVRFRALHRSGATQTIRRPSNIEATHLETFIAATVDNRPMSAEQKKGDFASS